MTEDPGTVWLILFVLGFITDIIWTLAVRCTAQNKILLAASFNAILAAIALVSTYIVVEQATLLGACFYVAGSFIGTLCTMSILPVHKLNSPKKKKRNKKGG